MEPLQHLVAVSSLPTLVVVVPGFVTHFDFLFESFVFAVGVVISCLVVDDLVVLFDCILRHCLRPTREDHLELKREA